MFRCYACDDEVPVEPESTLHSCIKLILKAMNLSPPPGDFNRRGGGFTYRKDMGYLSYLLGVQKVGLQPQKLPQQKLLYCFKCCFPLAEYERSGKRFSHTHLGVWVLVCGGYMAHKVAHFSCCCSPLPNFPPTHPSSFLEFFPAS